MDVNRQGLQRRCILAPEDEYDMAGEAGAHLQLGRSFVLGITNMSTFERKIYRTKAPNPTDVIGNPRGCCCCSGSNPTRPGTLHTSVPGQGRMQAPSLDPLPMTKVSIVRPIRIYAIEPRDPAISPALPLVVYFYRCRRARGRHRHKLVNDSRTNHQCPLLRLVAVIRLHASNILPPATNILHPRPQQA
ncbi:unnamed protein product [Fusarium fujikuroi]|nr:unnamed protein product [Fusarium fujikuroi]